MDPFEVKMNQDLRKLAEAPSDALLKEEMVCANNVRHNSFFIFFTINTIYIR